MEGIFPKEEPGFRATFTGHGGAIESVEVFESCNFEAQNNPRTRSTAEDFMRRSVARSFVRWILYFLMAVVMAGAYWLMSHTMRAVQGPVLDRLEVIASGSGFLGWLYYTAVMFCLVGIALICVLMKPAAGGSGLPELIAYLNGVRVRGVLDASTALAKFIGVTFAVASGLAIGPEAPVIHLGALIGVLVLNVVWMFGRNSRIGRYIYHLRSDREQRQLVTLGAALGITTAFHAPIGGVMFALEEAISFFNSKVIFRCAIVRSIPWRPVQLAGYSLSLASLTNQCAHHVDISSFL
jgi:chloride channel 7